MPPSMPNRSDLRPQGETQTPTPRESAPNSVLLVAGALLLALALMGGFELAQYMA